MKARTPTGCGRPTPNSASRTSRRASPGRSAARWTSSRACRSSISQGAARATTRRARRGLAAAEATIGAQGGLQRARRSRFPVGDGDQVHRAVGAADLQQAGPLHRLSRRRLGRDRRPPGGRPHRPYGAARRADRPPQPAPADGQSRRRAEGGAGARRANARSCWSISTASRRSTTASAMSPATICSSRSRAASRR